MTQAEFQQRVAMNIAKYRKNAGLTQLQLAEKLNYSDKAVSKWERGDSLPDAYMLFTLAELFGITLNDLVDDDEKRIADVNGQKNKRRRFITALSVGLVWLNASIVFLILKIIGVTAFEPAMLFLYAVPASFVVCVVFTRLWWSVAARAVTVSGLIWSLTLSIFLTVPIETTAYIFLTAGILQVLTALWFSLRKNNYNQSQHGNREEKS